jgi:NADPH2:quinone reductase
MADTSWVRAGILHQVPVLQNVLVLGATGPLRAAVIQLARLAGAKRVIAAVRNPERLAQVSAADGVALLGEEPLPDQLACLGGPVGLVVDPVWGRGRRRHSPANGCLRRDGGRSHGCGARASPASSAGPGRPGADCSVPPLTCH